VAITPGTVFADRYEILSVLGIGGMGQVYRAKHVGLQKEVALKVLSRKTLPDGVARFEREARAIARLDHPSCVRVLDYGTYGRSSFIAMELLDGPTLASALAADGRFSVQRALHVTRNVLAALVHAHAEGVLHRDLKPENIMLVTRGVPRTVLIDFGLAVLRDEASMTGAGLVIGSPSYVAPERLLGKKHTARADLWSVGVILYEMLAGTRPFVGDSRDEILRRALRRPARPLRAIRPDLPPALDALVARALAKDPAKRFADAEEMLSVVVELSLAPLDAPASASIAGAPRAHDGEASGSTMLRLQLYKPSLLSRLWSWIRYGRWRWHPSH
jgi:serine/threonine-protein kinase